MFNLKYPEFDFYLGLKDISRSDAYLKLSIIFSTYLSLEAYRCYRKLLTEEHSLILYKLGYPEYINNLYHSSLLVEIDIKDHILSNQYQKLIKKMKRYNNLN